ncbi:protein of unknown function [Acidithiobacillus ferrivorans]|uniref:Uncharacterized protein n=1 Tax=Acidithiobacillus ferrivorans TaxID=160808 RepID=A0A060UVL1_9PROT|nr:hypothetical protein AFERRI_400365 [Acidithiobacillus ferrivorans]SMH64615.1 protein of unknown function [Acidithiobacillus ferrivorans]
MIIDAAKQCALGMMMSIVMIVAMLFLCQMSQLNHEHAHSKIGITDHPQCDGHWKDMPTGRISPWAGFAAQQFEWGTFWRTVLWTS